jgi:flagellar biosynthesis protein FlhF
MLLADRLEVSLRDTLRFGTVPLAAHDRPLLVAGPPGAGKTLTVARLATRLVMAGTVPLVVSADGRRAGGTEQLAAFTRLLGIDLVVAAHPVALSQAFGRRISAGPALIDAPGCDPFDTTQIEELAAMASTADAEVALVLPAGLDPDEAADLALGFASLGTALLVGTRLDQERRLGSVVAAADAAGLALTEAGIGPGAADGLTALTPDLLAARLRSVPDPPAGLSIQLPRPGPDRPMGEPSRGRPA